MMISSIKTMTDLVFCLRKQQWDISGEVFKSSDRSSPCSLREMLPLYRIFATVTSILMAHPEYRG